MNWTIFRRADFWFGIVGVAGFVFAIYSYAISRKEGHISYVIETQKVFDPKNLRGFTLIGADRKTIEEPVFASELVLWNSGDLSVSAGSDRIREPTKISVVGAGRLHYFLIGSVNSAVVDNYKISIAPDQKTASIEWRYFDPGQGIRVTFIHSGVDDSRLAITGKFFEVDLRIAILPKTPGDVRIAGFVYLAAGVSYLLLGSFVFWRMRQRGNFSSVKTSSRNGSIFGLGSRRIYWVMLLACVLVGFFMLGSFFYISRTLSFPPV